MLLSKKLSLIGGLDWFFKLDLGIVYLTQCFTNPSPTFYVIIENTLPGLSEIQLVDLIDLGISV